MQLADLCRQTMKSLLLANIPENQGSYIDRSLASNDWPNALGELIVQLPSVFTGGRVSIYYNDDEERAQSTFCLGADEGASFSCYFLAHYKDCEFAIEKLRLGHRMLLTYSVFSLSRWPAGAYIEGAA